MEPNNLKNNLTVMNHVSTIQNLLQQDKPLSLDDLFAQLATAIGKKSFLVFKHNKYFTIAVEKIAYFYIKYETSIMVCMDQREYPVDYSLDHIQSLLTTQQFFRVNRQYLVNFNAVKEVEHYFARKLLVNLTVATIDKLLVPKEKVRLFLDWLEHR